MTGKVKVGVAIALGVTAIISAGITLWVNRPFQAEIGAYRTSLADRTEAQRHNIRNAVMALDGVVIEPGDTFSFNETVGPRTQERGYREAPAYMEHDLVTSVGGGICQVSSTVYNAAVLSGMEIVERHPHSRPIVSVPPGRDATVWYRKIDLRFRNGHPNPVRLAVKVGNEALFVSMWARMTNKFAIVLHTEPVVLTTGGTAYKSTRKISFFRKHSVQEVLSIDIYSN